MSSTILTRGWSTAASSANVSSSEVRKVHWAAQPGCIGSTASVTASSAACGANSANAA